MSEETISRVRYREGQTLRASDLSAEQAYRIGLRRRHHIGPHGWGIVTGLQIESDGEELVVQPGLALDGYGRELIVPRRVPLPLTACDPPMDIFQALGTDTIDIWLVYGREPATPPTRGRWDCGPGKHGRWHEEARLRLTAADTSDAFNPRLPEAVAAADLGFGPHQDPPDDPSRMWPVYLGRIQRTYQDPPIVQVDSVSRRPYAALIGELALAPSGLARLQVGGEQASDRRRFAVSLPGTDDQSGDPISIDGQGNTILDGDASVVGNLIMAAPEAQALPARRRAGECGPGADGEPVRPAWGITLEPVAAIPDEAAPWQVYRVIDETGDGPLHQLRAEIANPGKEGDPSQSRLVIGHRVNDQFKPCLTVTADCQVTVHGDLVVDGQVVQGPIQADPGDPRLVPALLEGWMAGLASGGVKSDAYYKTQLQVNLATETAVIGQVLNLQAVVTNAGETTLSNVRVFDQVVLEGSTVHSGQMQPMHALAEPSDSTTLEPSQSQFFADSGYTVPDDASLIGKELTVAVVAVGIGPLNTSAEARATGQITIYEPGPG